MYYDEKNQLLFFFTFQQYLIAMNAQQAKFQDFKVISKG